MTHFLTAAFGYDPIRPDPELRIEITVVGLLNGQYHTELAIKAMDGALLWVKEADYAFDCRTLMGDMAVAAKVNAKIILEPELPAKRPEPPAQSLPLPPAPAPNSESIVTSTASPAPPRKPSIADPAAARTQARRWKFRAGAGLDLSYGLAPGLALGGHVSLTVVGGRFTVSGEGRGISTIIPRKQGYYDAISGNFIGVAVVPCYYFIDYLPVCALAHGGSLTTSVAGYAPRSDFLLALGVRAGLEKSLGNHFALRAFAEGDIVPIAPPASRDNGRVPLSASPPLAVNLGSTVTVRW